MATAVLDKEVVSAHTTDNQASSLSSDSGSGLGTESDTLACGLPPENGMPTESNKPSGSDMHTGSNIAIKSALPSGSNMSSESDVDTGSSIATGSPMPTETAMPSGNSMSSGSDVDTGSSIATGSAMPSGSNMSSGSDVDTGRSIATGSDLHAGSHLRTESNRSFDRSQDHKTSEVNPNAADTPAKRTGTTQTVVSASSLSKETNQSYAGDSPNQQVDQTPLDFHRTPSARFRFQQARERLGMLLGACRGQPSPHRGLPSGDDLPTDCKTSIKSRVPKGSETTVDIEDHRNPEVDLNATETPSEKTATTRTTIDSACPHCGKSLQTEADQEADRSPPDLRRTPSARLRFQQARERLEILFGACHGQRPPRKPPSQSPSLPSVAERDEIDQRPPRKPLSQSPSLLSVAERDEIDVDRIEFVSSEELVEITQPPPRRGRVTRRWNLLDRTVPKCLVPKKNWLWIIMSLCFLGFVIMGILFYIPPSSE